MLKTAGVEMFKLNRQLTLRLLLLAWITFGIFASSIFAQQPVKLTSVFTPLNIDLTADSSVVSACPGEDGTSRSRVQLSAKANSPSGQPIRYRWSTTAGRVDAEGTTVTWDLSGLEPGYYQAFVHADTKNGEEVCEALSSTTVLVNRCTPRPVCPSAVIVCPDNVVADAPLTFSTTVTGGSAGVAPSYNWTVSAGRIVQGQGTSSITVDTTGLTGQTVKATVSVGGYNLDCSTSCAVSIPVPVPPARKFDEFPKITSNDEKARLDNFMIELKTDPASTAYVIVYPSQRDQSGYAQKHKKRIVDYLVNSRGFDARRIVTLVGPPRPNLLVELWNLPQGAKPPIADSQQARVSY
jgi:hypothetical protein